MAGIQGRRGIHHLHTREAHPHGWAACPPPPKKTPKTRRGVVCDAFRPCCLLPCGTAAANHAEAPWHTPRCPPCPQPTPRTAPALTCRRRLLSQALSYCQLGGVLKSSETAAAAPGRACSSARAAAAPDSPGASAGCCSASDSCCCSCRGNSSCSAAAAASGSGAGCPSAPAPPGRCPAAASPVVAPAASCCRAASGWRGSPTRCATMRRPNRCVAPTGRRAMFRAPRPGGGCTSPSLTPPCIQSQVVAPGWVDVRAKLARVRLRCWHCTAPSAHRRLSTMPTGGDHGEVVATGCAQARSLTKQSTPQTSHHPATDLPVAVVPSCLQRQQGGVVIVVTGQPAVTCTRNTAQR